MKLSPFPSAHRDPRQEHPHPALTILLQGLRLGISPGPGERGWSAGAASSPAVLGLGSGSGPMELEGDPTPRFHPVQVGAGERWTQSSEPWGGWDRGGVTEFTEHYKLRCQWQPQALLGRVKPPKPQQGKGALALLPSLPPVGGLCSTNSLPRESTVSPTRVFLPSAWAEGRAAGSCIPPDTPELQTWGAAHRALAISCEPERESLEDFKLASLIIQASKGH